MSNAVNRDYLIEKLRELVEVPSPTGYCKAVIELCESLSVGMGYKFSRNRKGNGIVEIDGHDNSYCVGVFVHVDTLGAMVRSINSDGSLRLTTLGGNMFSTLDGEYCKIHTRGGKVFTGTVLSKSPAVHVFDDAKTRARTEENMMVRLDEITHSRLETADLGIETGDFISIDPKFAYTSSGYVKSRYLDDKASTACMFAIMEMLKRLGQKPKYKTVIVFSTYEECGHGGAQFPDYVNEVLAFDMGCVGADLAGDETKVCICPKDSSGPYDYEMTGRLIDICKDKNLNYCLDIFPYYSSDASVALRAGYDIRAALVGPGVSGSHGMERTHIQGLEDSIKLVYAYLTE